MKKLLALLLIGAFAISVIPFATAYFPPPPPPPSPEFAMQVNGEWTDAAHTYNFTGQQFCTTFEVAIIAWSVEDLYAYSFNVTWASGADYIALVDSEVKHIHTDDFVILAESGDTWYAQAVTAIAPAEGFTGTAAVANLYFHIYNDAQWGDQVDIEILYTETAMSDSCTGDIEPSEQGAYIKLVPVQPTIKMLPPVTYSSVVGETFEVQFEIQNIIKMKSFHFLVTWDADQLGTDVQNVWIKDFLPPPYEETWMYVGEGEGIGFLEIDAWMPCEKVPINGTGELFGIRFTVLDPWAPEIPDYEMVENDHPIWYPIPCWNYINIGGYIDKGCVETETYEEQWLGYDIKVKGPDPEDLDEDPDTKFVYNEPCEYGEGQFIVGYFELRPIPGDLNLDGHVDIEDLSAIAKAYGDPNTFDIDGSGEVDIFDIVIVAKNFCRTEPDPVNPWPIFDP
jgi:hypothetical protein